MVLVPDVISIPDNSIENASDLIGHKASTRLVLFDLKLPTPNAFVITASAFYHFLSFENGLNKWRAIIDNAQVLSPENMVETSRQLQKLVLSHPFDPELVKTIHYHYKKQLNSQWAHLTISPTPRTKAPVNFPIPIIKGDTSLIDFLRQIWAAQLTPHALSLQLLSSNQLVDPAPILVSNHQQALVSGTIITTEPQTQNKNAMVIEAIYGTNPQNDRHQIPGDTYIVDRNSHVIISHKPSTQSSMIVADRYGHYQQKKIPSNQQFKAKLDQHQINWLVEAAEKIHSHQLSPQIINWLITPTGLLITRFEQFQTTTDTHQKSIRLSNQTSKNQSFIAKGLIAAPGIATGPIIRPSSKTSSLSGQIVILEQSSPTLLKRIRQAAGIIIESGGITSDIAITAREIGIPTLVGTNHINLENGSVVTLDAIKGEIVINRTPPVPTIAQTTPQSLPDTKESTLTATKIFLAVHQLEDLWDKAYQLSSGVGELAGNNIVTSLGIHPKRLVQAHYPAFEDALSQQIVQTSNKFGDRPIFYHPIDLTTTKARTLEHGKTYEPTLETNAYFGFRGAYRILNDPQVFDTEIGLITKLRNKHNLKNLNLCLPLVRSSQEFAELKKKVSIAKLHRSPSFKLGVKIGTPAALTFLPNIISQGVDTVFIDLDLLALTVLGYDPESSEVDQELSIAHPTVISILADLVKLADQNRVNCICQSYQLDHQFENINAVISTGVTGIIISPPRYNQVHTWLTQIETKLATSSRL